MKVIKQEYHIWAPLERVWDALVNPKTIEKWGAGKAEMSDKEEKKFSLWVLLSRRLPRRRWLLLVQPVSRFGRRFCLRPESAPVPLK